MPAPKDPEKRKLWKERLSKAGKGKPTWNKGYKYSEDPDYDEYRDKLSQVRKGKRVGFADGGRHSEETKQRLSEIGKGRVFTEDHRRNLSEASVALIRSGMHHFLTMERKNNKYKSGHHHSPKAGKVHYRSSYELAFFQQLDAEPEVSTYEVETLQIPYKFEGKKRTYIPDVLIHYVDGTQEIVEIKPEALLDTPENDAKLEAAFKQYGDQFVIVTEQELFQ